MAISDSSRGLRKTSNVISVDVEDYFQVEAFTDIVDRAQWASYPSRVEKNTLRMLDLLDGGGVKGPFSFWAGWPIAFRRWFGKSCAAATNWPATPTGTG